MSITILSVGLKIELLSCSGGGAKDIIVVVMGGDGEFIDPINRYKHLNEGNETPAQELIVCLSRMMDQPAEHFASRITRTNGQGNTSISWHIVILLVGQSLIESGRSC